MKGWEDFHGTVSTAVLLWLVQLHLVASWAFIWTMWNKTLTELKSGVRSLHGLCFLQPGARFEFRWWKIQGFLDLRMEVGMCRCCACKMFWFPGEANVPTCQGGIPRNRTVLVSCAALAMLAQRQASLWGHGFKSGFQEVSRRCWVRGSAMCSTCATGAGAGFRQQNYYQRLSYRNCNRPEGL